MTSTTWTSAARITARVLLPILASTLAFCGTAESSPDQEVFEEFKSISPDLTFEQYDRASDFICDEIRTDGAEGLIRVTREMSTLAGSESRAETYGHLVGKVIKVRCPEVMDQIESELDD